MKIAVSSSGLEHIKRGVEVSAKNLASALAEKGINVTLYKGSRSALSYVNGVVEKTIPCVRRNSRLMKMIQRIRPAFLWHLGLGSEYEVEQTSFSSGLAIAAIFKQFDIIHTKDPLVAKNLNLLSKIGLIKSKVIFCHGTEEPLRFLKKFNYIQHLSPYLLEQTRKKGIERKRWFAIPNFVDTNRFNPQVKSDLRQRLDIPEDALVIISVAAIKRHHKRIDYLIKEVAALNRHRRKKAFLLIVGSKTEQTPGLINLGKDLLGNQIRFLIDHPSESMPETYRSADIFVLGSLFEMFGTVFVEAMASGLCLICHKHPNIQRTIAEAGICIDMTKEGELTKTIEKYSRDDLRKEMAQKARARVLREYSKEIVVEQIIAMYKAVLNEN